MLPSSAEVTWHDGRDFFLLGLNSIKSRDKYLTKQEAHQVEVT